MLGNTEGDDQNVSGDLCPYIFIYFGIIVHMEVHSVRGQRRTVD
jgi:hypothetical protein